MNWTADISTELWRLLFWWAVIAFFVGFLFGGVAMRFCIRQPGPEIERTPAVVPGGQSVVLPPGNYVITVEGHGGYGSDKQ